MSRAKRLISCGTAGRPPGPRYIGATDLPLAPEGMEDIARVAPFSAGSSSTASIAVRSCAAARPWRSSGSAETADRRRSAGDRLRRLGRPDLRRDMRTRRCGRRPLGPLVGGFFLPAGREYPGFSQTDRRHKKNGAGRAGEHLLLVSHGGVIRQLVCACLGLGPENYLLFDVQPASAP